MPMSTEDVLKLHSLIRPKIASLRHSMRIGVGEDDLVQETLLKLIESGREPVEPGYAVATAKNVCFSAKRLETGSEVSLEEAYGLPSGDDESTRQRLWLDSQLGRMPWEGQKLLRMRLNGFSHEDIGREFCRSKGWACKE